MRHVLVCVKYFFIAAVVFAAIFLGYQAFVDIAHSKGRLGPGCILPLGSEGAYLWEYWYPEGKEKSTLCVVVSATPPTTWPDDAAPHRPLISDIHRLAITPEYILGSTDQLGEGDSWFVAKISDLPQLAAAGKTINQTDKAAWLNSRTALGVSPEIKLKYLFEIIEERQLSAKDIEPWEYHCYASRWGIPDLYGLGLALWVLFPLCCILSLWPQTPRYRKVVSAVLTIPFLLAVCQYVYFHPANMVFFLLMTPVVWGVFWLTLKILSYGQRKQIS